jgi:hypothetical protein
MVLVKADAFKVNEKFALRQLALSFSRVAGDANSLTPFAQKSGTGGQLAFKIYAKQELPPLSLKKSDRLSADDELGRVEVDLYGKFGRYALRARFERQQPLLARRSASA